MLGTFSLLLASFIPEKKSYVPNTRLVNPPVASVPIILAAGPLAKVAPILGPILPNNLVAFLAPPNILATVGFVITFLTNDDIADGDIIVAVFATNLPTPFCANFVLESALIPSSTKPVVALNTPFTPFSPISVANLVAVLLTVFPTVLPNAVSDIFGIPSFSPILPNDSDIRASLSPNISINPCFIVPNTLST